MATNTILANMAVRISAHTAQFAAEMKKATGSMYRVQQAAMQVRNVLGAAGLGLGIYQVVGVLKSAISSLADFEHNMQKVRAISNATDEQFQKLRKTALDLGRTTKFTAGQVAELELALARLGFKQKDISNVAGAIVDLATATDEDLAKSADVVGFIVRQFGFESKEAIRVVDVMARSFSDSALTLENFSNAMEYIGPLAKQAGVSFEQTAAMLAVLANNGLRGSKAGTGLARIFTEIAKDGRPVQERLRELSGRGISVADAFDEVGQRALAAMLVLSSNQPTVDNFTDALDNATGSVKKMADIIQDDLTGDLIRLSSAYDGLIQTVGNTGPLRDAVTSITNFVNAITDLIETEPGITRWQRAFLVWARASAIFNPVLREQLKLMDELVKIIERGDRSFGAVGVPQFSTEGTGGFSDFLKLIESFTIKPPPVPPIGVDSLTRNRVSDSLAPKPEDVQGYTQLTDSLKGFTAALGENIVKVETHFQTMEEWGDMTRTLAADQQEQWTKMAEIQTAAADSIGTSLGALISGQFTFAQALQNVVNTIVDAYARQAIAAILAKAAADPTAPFPIIAIAKAAAAAALIKGLFAKIGSSVGGGGGGGYASSTRNITGFRYSDTLAVTGEFVLRGDVLVAAVDKANRRNGRVKG